MASVGAYEAKTHLSQLLDRAEQGERITITRHGRPVAHLVPARDAASEGTASEMVAALLEFRREHRLGGDLSVRDLIDEGRKQ